MKMERIFTADDESARVFGSNDPLRRARSSQAVVRTVKGMESPNAAERSYDLAVEVRRFQGMGVDDESSALGVRLG